MRLSAYHATSTNPQEVSGIMEDQELIATGVNDTASFPSVLIEYSYLYEPQFLALDTRGLAAGDYAFVTYASLRDFFGTPLPNRFGTTLLPHTWNASPVPDETSADALALQAALHHLGFYPPAGKSFSDCPVSGRMGDCTVAAVKTYQASKGFEQTGALGPLTRAALATDLR